LRTKPPLEVVILLEDEPESGRDNVLSTRPDEFRVTVEGVENGLFNLDFERDDFGWLGWFLNDGHR
jgi:hypothetical protein